MLRNLYDKYSTSQNGFTLIELLVALAVNLILLLALTSMYSSNVGHFNEVQKIDILNQQMQSAMQLMTRDIRRAGYWNNAVSDLNTAHNNNPFMAPGADLSVNGSNNCILFSYDYNSDNTLPSISTSVDDERSGYRLVSQTLQARPRGAAFDCGAASSAWENIIDPTLITITNLTFTLNTTQVPVGATSDYILIRSVDISMTGQLVSNASVSKTLTQHVRIRNDKYVP
jgi:prepilin-type N-terminal cleavage/methylation domain-containing protein